jgi:large subunit ribosomal protein L23
METMNKQSYGVIVRPLVTEKSSALKAEANKVVFEVKRSANKIDVKNAVEGLFGVTVTDVATMVVRGKHKRVGTSLGRRSNWKKAVVTLKAGTDLDVFGVQTAPAEPAAEAG